MLSFFAVILRDLRRVVAFSVPGHQMYAGSVSVVPAAYKRQLPRRARFQYKLQFAHTVYFRLRRLTTNGKKRNGIDMGIYPKRRHKVCERSEMLFAAILLLHIRPRREGNVRDRIDTTQLEQRNIARSRASACQSHTTGRKTETRQ